MEENNPTQLPPEQPSTNPIPPQPNPNSPLTPQANTTPPQENPIQKNKSTKFLILLILIIVLLCLGSAAYFAYGYLNNQSETSLVPDNSLNETQETAQTITLTPSPEPIINNYDEEQLVSLLGGLVSSQNLEFKETGTIIMEGGCVGTGETHGIIQGTNYYSFHLSTFDQDTIEYCPVDLHEVYAETYWIDGQIYYKQYSHNEFQLKDPESNIAIPPVPRDVLTQLIPSRENIQVIESNSPGQISFTGNNSGSVGNYSLELSANNTISKIYYDIAYESDNVKSQGSISFNIPTEILTAPGISQ